MTRPRPSAPDGAARQARLDPSLTWLQRNGDTDTQDASGAQNGHDNEEINVGVVAKLPAPRSFIMLSKQKGSRVRPFKGPVLHSTTPHLSAPRPSHSLLYSPPWSGNTKDSPYDFRKCLNQNINTMHYKKKKKNRSPRY